MIRGLTPIASGLAIIILALAVASPGFAQGQSGPAADGSATLRLLNDAQFKEFLKRLDADLMSWKARLKAVNVAALRLGPEEVRELRRSYTLCLLALENSRGDIQQLSQKQTLKRDFMLLVDLQGLARSLDGLSGNLASAVPLQRPGTAQKSLGWARDVLSVDAALAAHLAEIQRHVLALAGLLDAALERAETLPEQSRHPK